MEKLTKKYMTEGRKKNEEDIDACLNKYLEGNVGKKNDLTETTNNTDRGVREITFIRSKLSSLKDPIHVAICGCLLGLVGCSVLVNDEGLKSQLRSTARMILGKL